MNSIEGTKKAMQTLYRADALKSLKTQFSVVFADKSEEEENFSGEMVSVVHARSQEEAEQIGWMKIQNRYDPTLLKVVRVQLRKSVQPKTNIIGQVLKHKKYGSLWQVTEGYQNEAILKSRQEDAYNTIAFIRAVRLVDPEKSPIFFSCFTDAFEWPTPEELSACIETLPERPKTNRDVENMYGDGI